MIERLLQVGSPCPLPLTGTIQGGTGGLCTTGILTPSLGGTQYKHVPFVQNGINSTASAGQDVTSYNFSGCIMATFKDNGIVYVCHVSTGDGQDCKAAWNIIKGRSTNVFEFKPSDYIETGGAALLGCFGLITSDLQTWAITVVQNAVMNGNPKIGAITRARLLH